MHRRKLQGRPGLEHLPDDREASEVQRHNLLRSAVSVYQSRFPALKGRFRKGTTEGRSGLETRFRSPLGYITPQSLHAAQIIIDEPKLAADLQGLSPRQVVFHMEQALGEEVRHLATLIAALGLWHHQGRPKPLEPWLTKHHSDMWRQDFSPAQRTAVLHAYAGNHGQPVRCSRFSVSGEAPQTPHLQERKLNHQPPSWVLAIEALRMFSQARSGTLPTEADQLMNWPKSSTHDLPQLLQVIHHTATTAKLPDRLELALGAVHHLLSAWHHPRPRPQSLNSQPPTINSHINRAA